MSKRGENIYKRKDGRYEGRFLRPHLNDTKPSFGYVYGYSYSDVKNALIKAKAAPPPSPLLHNAVGDGSLSDFLSFWLLNLPDSIKPSTLAQYYDRISSYILPALGNTPLPLISPDHIREFSCALTDKNLAHSTASNILSLLRIALNAALSLNLIPSNPFDAFAPPNPPSSTISNLPLNRSEQISLEILAASAKQSIKFAVFIALYAGLRIGEICALRWNNISPSPPSIAVNSTIQRVASLPLHQNALPSSAKSAVIEGPPKSARSLRSVPIPPMLLDILAPPSPTPAPDSFLLSNKLKPFEPRTIRAQFAKLAKAAGFSITFHSLRHTYATRCLENNFDIQSLSEMLGHSSPATTMRTYTHSVIEHKRELASRLSILSDDNS